ncbi:hypothetical protein O6H91_02G067500 [Diphasiastrum complanatum]|uniref:Uncharacterized protein n=1 Tax=Diphasiastrum complanatum TaxID=34168 RepID=A0ACC2EGC5_DIPCM|nr:hypothetical protein O6H91_02G067500 [Diphasiastrum complanatum]
MGFGRWEGLAMAMGLGIPPLTWNGSSFSRRSRRSLHKSQRGQSAAGSGSQGQRAGKSGWRFPMKPAITAGALALLGDTAAQLQARWARRKALESCSDVVDPSLHKQALQDASLTNHDWLRAIRMATYGFLLYGPGSQAWYELLDRYFQKKTTLNLSLKVVLNQIILGPCVILVIFAWNSLWQHRIHELPSQYKTLAIPTLVDGWKFWTPASVLNFGVVPLQARVAFMSCCSIFWNFYLSHTMGKSNEKKGGAPEHSWICFDHVKRIHGWTTMAAHVYDPSIQSLQTIAICEMKVEETKVQVKFWKMLVVVALSHATVVEESMQARDLLIEKNIALECAKREAELAVVARNEFLAVMNHEMRTPMHAIIALSSLLRESKLTTEQVSMIDTISKSSSILSMLINDVLDFTRLEAGSLCLDPQAFQLSNFLKEAEELVTPMAQSKKLPLSMAIRGMIPSNVCADSNRILQVFLNVGNSIKFTSEGHIKICVYVEDADSESMPSELSSPRREVKHMFLHFNVEDTGIGIKASDLQRLFHKFVQADSSITRNFGGSGLGLAIARKFVELMGGKIRLESEGLGKGSTCKFFVSLGVVLLGFQGEART